MSDISGLSQDYSSASELASALNRSLIVLKKRHFALPGSEQLGPAQIDEARQTLAAIVRILALLLRSGPGGDAPSEAAVEAAGRVPPSLISRLKDEWSGALQWRLQDLDAIAQRLSDPVTLHDMTPQDFERLDELARAAEAETSQVFRLMMRGS